MVFLQAHLGTGGTPSLDISLQNSTWKRGSVWGKKHKRLYSCALTGIKRCWFKRREVFFLTLTSCEGAKDLARHWDLLVKRVRRDFGFAFEFVKVETFEGNGVIHALVHSAFTEKDGFEVLLLDINDGLFKKTRRFYDAVHAYFSVVWQELHGSPVVWWSVVKNPKKVANYIVQYVAGQIKYCRKSNSFGWVFRSWRKYMMNFISYYGFDDGLKRWDLFLRSDDMFKTDGVLLSDLKL